MDIFIPTKGRLFQETYNSLPEDLRQQVRFVTPWEERMIVGARVIRTPEGIHGIGPTRQYIADIASEKFVMLDDDLVFATRRTDEPAKFRNSTPTDLRLLFDSISTYLDNFAHVGVSTREGGNRDTHNIVFNTRLLRILAYRNDVLRREGVRFDRVELMEDFDVTLQLLERGYTNVRINTIVHNQRSSNAAGGCSTYRTMEKQSAAARRLQELHPAYVTVVTKQTKTAWNGQEREDVRIGWKKAFDSAGTVAILDQGA